VWSDVQTSLTPVRDRRVTSMCCNSRLTSDNTRKQDETSSLIYFYSSYLNADNGYFVKLEGSRR
jgi:hypothetical protein